MGVIPLGGEVYVEECPITLVPRRIWNVIDLFHFCYTKQPGLSGWVLNRTHLPESGGIMDQSNWVLWAFQYIENLFYKIQHEQSKEQDGHKPISHEEIKKKFGIK